MTAKHKISPQCRDTPWRATWTATDVANQLEEAVSTLKKLPPVRVQGYFSVWPEFACSPQELLMQEAQPIHLVATPAAITRLEQTLDWTGWVEAEERKLIWRRAARVRWRVICWEMGCTRMTVWRRWMSALDKIANQLNNPQQVAQKRG